MIAMNPFNNRWVAVLLVAGVLLVVSELVGSPGHEGALARFGIAAPAPVAAAPPAPMVAAAPPAVVIEEDPEPEPDDAALDEADADPGVVEVTVIEDAPVEAPEASIVSTEAPGPPGVFVADN